MGDLSELNIPAELKYTEEHEWVRVQDSLATIGITDYAQIELGDIVNVELPEEGDVISREEAFGAIESVKASSEVFAPVSGKVVEVNDPLYDTPEIVNEDPYQNGWLIKVELQNPAELDDLMDAAAYRRFLEEESK